MLSKSKFGDSEEDLLELQRKFYEEKKEGKIQASTKFSAEYKKEQELKPIVNKAIENEEKIIVGSVIEKNTTTSTIQLPFEVPSKGFPEAKRRVPGSTDGTSKSLFSRNSKRPKPGASTSLPSSSKPIRGINVPPKSNILTGKEANSIHKENVDFLQSHTEEEILKERDKLLSCTDPALIQFLRSLKRKTDHLPSDTENLKSHTKTEIQSEKLQTVSEILSNPNVEKWLHFDHFEPDKLQWMEDVKTEKDKSKDKPYEARFDFSGWLLPYKEEITEQNRALFHHGEEPERPGYTLQELLQLCRSSVQQQKIIALNTIANILSLHTTGAYDDVIDIPIEQIFFVIRFCLDENVLPVLEASLKAMRNLLYYDIDETCLDNTLGFGLSNVQPVLAVKRPTDEKEDDTINDQQLVEMDMIKCLVRSNILARIRYVLATVQPNDTSVVYCLEILTRLMRDSHSIMVKTYNFENLFSLIVKLCIPEIYKLDMGKVKMQIAAVKLMRISASRSKHIAAELLTKYSLMQPITSYIANDIGINMLGVKLQTESFRLWKVFLQYGMSTEYVSPILPNVLTALEYHINNSNISPFSYYKQAHFSALIGVLEQISKVNHNLRLLLVNKLTPTICKWLSQCCILKTVKSGQLQIVSSALVYLSDTMEGLAGKCPEIFETPMRQFLKSSGFSSISENLRNSSNLLSDFKTHKTGSSFNSLEASVWKTSDHVVPCLTTSSSLPFMAALCNSLIHFSSEIQLLLFRHRNILSYLKCLSEQNIFNLTSNWFTRVESAFLANLLKMCTCIRSSLSDEEIYLIFSVAIKAIYAFHSDQKRHINFIFKGIIFNKAFFTTDVALRSLNISNETDVSTLLDDICKNYIEVLDLEEKPLFINNLVIDLNIGNVLPVDWLFAPIIMVVPHESKKSYALKESQSLSAIYACLQWMIFFESNFHTLSSLIDPTDQFCRLACIFLSDNSLFLDRKLNDLLRTCLKLLIDNYSINSLNFDKSIEGLTHFQDFYTELLEQYQGVSYGDTVFANFILIPLAQRHNVKWRKMLWSEYAGVVQILFIKEEEVVYPSEEFLSPIETDESVLTCYKQCLVSGKLKRSPFLQKVALHHLQMQSDNLNK